MIKESRLQVKEILTLIESNGWFNPDSETGNDFSKLAMEILKTRPGSLKVYWDLETQSLSCRANIPHTLAIALVREKQHSALFKKVGKYFREQTPENLEELKKAFETAVRSQVTKTLVNRVLATSEEDYPLLGGTKVKYKVDVFVPQNRYEEVVNGYIPLELLTFKDFEALCEARYIYNWIVPVPLLNLTQVQELRTQRVEGFIRLVEALPENSKLSELSKLIQNEEGAIYLSQNEFELKFFYTLVKKAIRMINSLQELKEVTAEEVVDFWEKFIDFSGVLLYYLEDYLEGKTPELCEFNFVEFNELKEFISAEVEKGLKLGFDPLTGETSVNKKVFLYNFPALF